MTGTARIRWEQARYGGWSGHAGTLDRMFMIWGDARCWTLSSAFPVLCERYRRDEDPEVLKLAAEEWLEEFAVSLGAVFPGAAEARWEALKGYLTLSAEQTEAALHAAEASGEVADAIAWGTHTGAAMSALAKMSELEAGQ